VRGDVERPGTGDRPVRDSHRSVRRGGPPTDPDDALRPRGSALARFSGLRRFANHSGVIEPMTSR
jgi:hypothetical protein